jgi:peptidyl-prolyl cis-trans isomerase A (cyclophilin A)
VIRLRSALLCSVTGVLAACASTNPASAPVPVVQAAVMTSPPDSAAIAGADSVLLRFATTKGDIDVMVRRSWAPNGAPRVAEAVAAGYYDGARFFRALRGFVIQWGIAADTAQSKRWSARSIPDDTVRESNRRGTVTFAAGGANTRTVQLFVNLRDNARLDAMRFAPVGEVVRGMDVVDALHTGYGEAAPSGKGPSQGKIGAEGEAYLARDFPLLDQIRSARVVRLYAASR